MAVPLAELEVAVRDPDRASIEVEARFADDLETASVRSRIFFTAGRALDEIPIVLAADQYRAEPELTPSQVREIFPSGFSEGGFREVAIRVDGAPCRPRLEKGTYLAWCRHPLGAGGSARIEVDATLDVPRRFGPFGRVGREVTLAAGWYPYVARPSDGPPRGRQQIKVEAPGNLVTVLRSRHFPANEQARRTVETIEEDAAQVPLIFRPAYARSLPIAGGRARHLTGPASLLVREEDETLHTREVRAGISDGLAFWQEEELPLPEPNEPLIIVKTALRHDLAQAADGLILVSDRAFRMLDVDRFLRFHRFPILREVFGELIDRQLPKRAADRALVRDAIASWMVDRYVTSRFGRAEDAFDVLGIVSFIPAIDSMLYAPDLPYVSAYFRLMREDDPLRPDLLSFPQRAPKGKLIYEKLLDRFGAQGAEETIRRLMRGEALTEAVRQTFPDPNEAQKFLETWLGPHPNLQYKLAAWSEAPAPDVCATCVRATAQVDRIGDEAAEPIEVRFTDEEGEVRIIRAPATTDATRTVTATLASPVDLIEVDPRGRLAEAPAEDQPSPRYDNRNKPEWKILLNNFNIVVAATEGAVDTALDIGIERRFDVHWGYAVRLDYAQEGAGLSARASYSFGETVTAARLAHFIGAGISGELLREGFVEGAPGGQALGASLSYGYDNRKSIWAPETGTGVRLSASYYQVLGADLEGTNTTNEALGLTARFLQQWRLGLRHQLSVRASAAAYAVGRPRPQLLWALGGRGGVRGYALGDELGRVRGILSAEWLHPLLPEWEQNGFYMAWVNGIDGAFYGDVALIGDTLEEATAGPVFGDVGYGLRLYIDYLGVRPGVMSVDFAFPLVRARGATELGGPAIYISFGQSFTTF